MLVFFMLVGMTVRMLMHLNHSKDGYFFQIFRAAIQDKSPRGTCQMLPFFWVTCDVTAFNNFFCDVDLAVCWDLGVH